MAQRNEIIFTQTDLLFNFAQNAVTELRQLQRLLLTHSQEAYLYQVQSNIKDHEDCFGAKPGKPGQPRRTAFSRGMECVLRHLMLNATGIPENVWPDHHKPGKQKLQLERNHKNMQKNFNKSPPNHFMLTENAAVAQYYYSSYDHQFPLYRLENILAEVEIGNLAQIRGQMFIFRFNANKQLTYVIEIITTGGAVEDPNNRWRMSQAYARVICIVSEVLAGDDGKWMKKLNSILPQPEDAAEAPNSTLEMYSKVIPNNPQEPCDFDKLCEELKGFKVTKDTENNGQ